MSQANVNMFLMKTSTTFLWNTFICFQILFSVFLMTEVLHLKTTSTGIQM